MPIENQLRELRLHGMQRSWDALTQTRRHLELSATDTLELLLQAELEERRSRRYDRLAQNARFWKFHSILTHLFHSKLTQVFHSILTHPFQSKLTNF